MNTTETDLDPGVALPTIKITAYDAERVKIWVSDTDAIQRLPHVVVGELFTAAWEAFKAGEVAANE